MIICFEASKQTKDEVDFLLNNGTYSDMNQVLNMAVANLALLQRRVGVEGAIVLESGGGPSEVPNLGSGSARDAASGRPRIVVPALLALPMYEDEPPPFAPMPMVDSPKNDEFTLESWLFGQFNRLLPVKIACRGLANLMIRQPSGVKIDVATSSVVDAASKLGSSLREFEVEYDLHRDHALSTAFPATGKKADKSRLRFSTQFVVGKNKDGDLTGFLADLGLINYSSDNRDQIALTEPGWNFAYVSNPVLESKQEEPTQKFTVEEQEILVSHIIESVPVEDFAFRTVLEGVRWGYSNPSDLDSKIAEFAVEGTSPAFISTQRSGVVCRMIDLGLIARVRNGIRVEYIITSDGSEYLAREPERSVEEGEL